MCRQFIIPELIVRILDGAGCIIPTTDNGFTIFDVLARVTFCICQFPQLQNHSFSKLSVCMESDVSESQR